MKSTSKIAIFSLIAGAAVGAVLGILYAPDKGSVTRKKLKDKAEDLGDKVSEKYDSFKNEMKNMKERMKTGHKQKAEVNQD